MGYPKEVYERAWDVLEQRKQDARNQTQSRRVEIHQRIPEIAGLEREIAATAASVAKTVLSSPNKAGELVTALGQKNLELQKRRATLLEQNGYAPDYLEEHPNCPHCRDSGYVKTRMCGCLKELLRKEAYARLSQTVQTQECTFHNFRMDYYPDQPVDSSNVIPRERMAEVLSACRQYAEGFHRQSESLLMLGQTGLGKTHLSLAIAQAVTGAGFGVVYTPAQRLMDRLESEKFSRDYESKERYRETTRDVLECDLLILDDLGTEFATSFTNSALYNVVNSRLVEQRPTVISTNLDLGGIEERYSQRMVSRLVCSYKVLKFYGKDIRYMKKMQSLR